MGNETVTLADVIGSSENGLYNGRRVRLSSAEVSEYGTRIPMEACGRLHVEDIYTEKCLLCHAFIKGKNSYPHTTEVKALSRVYI